MGGRGATSNLSQTNRPSVWAFEIKPLVTTDKITIGWSLHDDDGDLDRVGILRAADLNGRPDPDSWIELLDLRGGADSYGEAKDIPPAGISWYSLYVTDKAGNVAFARDPIQVNSTRVRGGAGDLQPSFQDVSHGHWAFDDIELLYRNGFTKGCSEGLEYCPDQGLTRAEYAVFAERSYHGTGHVPEDPALPYFIDTLLGDWFTNWVEGLRLDGLTAGCALSPPAFCPLQELPRKEGAVIALRIMNGEDYRPPTPVGIFVDAKGDWSDAWVEAAFQAGLLAPCEPGWEPKFCPDRPLTRAMTAHMMVIARGLSGSLELTSFRMLDATDGWATSDPKQTQILRTTDGGKTWRSVTPAETALGRSEVFFLNSTHAWVISFLDYLDPIVWRTKDGGDTWEASHLYAEPMDPGAPTHERAWMKFSDADHGWLTLDYSLGMMNPWFTVTFQTTNGGTTWERGSDPPCNDPEFGFLDAQFGWMLCASENEGEKPRLFQTNDGGQNWSTIELPLENEEISTCSGGAPMLLSSKNGALMFNCWPADYGSQIALLLQTQDGGQTWRSSKLPGDSSQLVAAHYDLQFLNPQTAILFGPDGYSAVEPLDRPIHRTLDGGQTWEKMGSLPGSAQISFVDIDHGWALMTSATGSALFYTADGGRTWDPLSIHVTP